MDGFYDGAMNSAIDGKFKAVCLSGIKTESNTGEGTGANDAAKKGGYINLVVRPLTGFGDIMPDPRRSKDPDEINGLISLHSSTFLARSDYSFDVTNPISFGQVIDCYFEKGSITSSDFRTLRFTEPKDKVINTSFVNLGLISGVQTAMDADWTSASLLGLDVEESTLAVDNVMKKWANELPAVENFVGGVGINVTTLQTLTDSQLQFWKGKKEKGSGPEFGVLTTYWSKIGVSNWTYNGTPWSAAFISWILMTSGTGFPGAASHMKYTENIINGQGPGWSAYSLTKGPPIINIGDVLIRPRGSGTPKDDAYWYSHGDVVYKIENNVAFLAGGNLGDTAKVAAKISIDSSGRASDTKNYIVILKKGS